MLRFNKLVPKSRIRLDDVANDGDTVDQSILAVARYLGVKKAWLLSLRFLQRIKLILADVKLVIVAFDDMLEVQRGLGHICESELIWLWLSLTL